MSYSITSHDDYQRLPGLEVFGINNDRIGTVARVLHPADDAADVLGGHLLVITTGPLRGVIGADTLYVPEDAVQILTEDRVVLEITAGQMVERGWTSPPGRGYESA